MRKPWINAFTFNAEDIKGEVNELPSKTVPDMTMSLREILQRYTRGGEIATLQPVYQNHDDFDDNPDISKMDGMERLQYAKAIKDAIAEHQNRPQPVKEKAPPDPEGKSEGEAKREPEAEPEEKGGPSKEKQ